jgi:two-component system, NarL family, response regulator LiaR
MSQRIRVFAADDHGIVLHGLEALLATTADMALVGVAADGDAAVAGALAHRPDVTLLDLQMPGRSGSEAIAAICAAWPEARILVLTSFGDDEHVFAAIQAGALGYVLKETPPDRLLQAIRDVAAGRPHLEAGIALKLLQSLHQPPPLPPAPEPLTEREVDVLQLVARGLPNREIGEALFISERTVRTHISNILAKLHLANRTQAALWALREGMANLED